MGGLGLEGFCLGALSRGSRVSSLSWLFLPSRVHWGTQPRQGCRHCLQIGPQIRGRDVFTLSAAQEGCGTLKSPGPQNDSETRVIQIMALPMLQMTTLPPAGTMG